MTIIQIVGVCFVVMLAGWLPAGCARTPPTLQAALQEDVAQLRTTIDTTVTDPGRREQLLDRAAVFERTVTAFSDELQAFANELHALNRVYDTPDAQIKAAFDAFETKRQVTLSQLLALHMEMLQLTPEQEWKPIAKAEVKTLRAMSALPPETK